MNLIHGLRYEFRGDALSAQLWQDDRVVDVKDAGRRFVEVGVCQEISLLAEQEDVFLVHLKFQQLHLHFVRGIV